MLTQRGYTLVEFMISIAISMVIVLGGMNLYLSVMGTGKNLREHSILTEELRAVGGVLVRDIRRTGYWSWDPMIGPGDIWNNPFTAGGNDLLLSEFGGEAANSCILYSYDVDDDGVVDSNENFGFRMASNAIEMYDSGSFSCTAGTWTGVSSPEVNVTSLAFTLTETCLDVRAETTETCPCDTGDICQHVRRVNVNLTAQLVSDPLISESLSESVRIRNDKFVSNVP